MAVERTPVVFGNARFTVFSDGCVRLEYSRGGKFSPYPSLLVGESLPRARRADVRRRGRRVRVVTPRMELEYRDDGRVFHAGNLTIRHRNAFGEEETWVPGKQDRGNLGEVTRSLDEWSQGVERHAVEGILSTAGGHCVEDRARVYWNRRFGWPEDMSGQVDFDGYFFAYGDDYKAALRDFVAVFGKIPMVPRWVFGFWYSRWYAYRAEEFIELARRYRGHGIPVDVMVIDTDWRDGWGGYDWSRKYFPDPRGALRRMHAEGLHVGLNDHPGYDAYEALPEGDSHRKVVARELGPLPHGGRWCCDWSRPDAVATWCRRILGPFLGQGVDFWWIDGWTRPQFGANDSQLWLNRVYYELAHGRRNRRGLILSRWGGVGSHRYPVQFSGDTYSTWETLRHEIDFTARSAGLGAVYWSHDIGGFHDRRMDEDLYIRWVQFGSLSPVFRTHSAGGIREPWRYGRRALAVFRKQTRMRYALAPYLYTLAYRAHVEGLPLVRPMYLEYNRGDRDALEVRGQYMLGPELLVVPADRPGGGRDGECRKRAYFPPGKWYGLESGEVIEGGRRRELRIPVERIPVYVRAGALLPVQPVGEYLGSAPPRVLGIEYYPLEGVASRTDIYDDDGESLGYESGEFALTPVTARKRGDTIRVTIGRVRGGFRGIPRGRRYELRVRLEEGQRVETVDLQRAGGARRSLKWRVERSCLAGEIRSRARYCVVAVPGGEYPLSVRMRLAEEG